MWDHREVDSSRIAAAPAFAKIPTSELEALADVMSEREVAAGAHITDLDDYTTSVFLVEQGEADVLSDGGEVIRALGPGDTFGEISLVLTGQRTATVVARTPMRLLSLADQAFQGIRDRVPEFEDALRRLGLERAAR
jgi:CRP-like cAMP-binding protein